MISDAACFRQHGLNRGSHFTVAMGYTIWYFAFDAQNEAHPLTRASASTLNDDDFAIAPGVPARDDGGVLVADVIVGMENRVPVVIKRIHLTPLPANEAAVGKETAPFRGVVAALRMALRRKLHGRGDDVVLTAEQACDDLERRIASGEVDRVYRTSWDRVHQAVERMGRYYSF